MSTFIFSPGLQILIDTLGNGIIDITEDVMSGSVTLEENSPSKLEVTFLNQRRKYDGVFTPNDIIVLRLKRLNWMPVFTGYLNSVPYFSTYPKAVNLTATCTLKRLTMQVWDQGSEASSNLLRNASDGNQADQVDGGLRDKIMAIMEQVAGWPRYQIHIGQIPSDWVDRLNPLREKLAGQIGANPYSVGMSGVANGTNATASGSQQIEGNGPGTGTLPATRGRTGVISTNQLFELTDPERSGPGGVGSETGPVDEWFVQMRWPYREDTALTPLSSEKILSSIVMTGAKKWWKNRKILVVNPTNNRAVVLRAVDWGPSPTTGNVADISPAAMASLGGKAVKGRAVLPLEFRFASDTAQIGPQPEQTVEFNPSFGGNTQVAQPQYVNLEGDTAWSGWQGLQPHAATARLFVKANWKIPGDIGGRVVRNIQGTNKVSDHATGQAIDIPISKGRAKGAQEAMGNAIAQWFVANPNVFGTKYVIWMDRINSGNGWRAYNHPGGSGDTLQHRDHVHVSFLSGSRTEAGAMGSPWNGSNNSDFGNYILSGNGASINQGGPDGSNLTGLTGPDGLPLLNAFSWEIVPSVESGLLTGARALLNDTPIWNSIKRLTEASMRSFMSAPNGDFIAWFPDYFGHYGMASKIIVRDIELAGQGFTIQWSDDNLVTHQFVVGAMNGYNWGGSSPGGTIDYTDRLATMGIATVEFTELMEALFNAGPGSSSDRKNFFINAEAILQRFGARVNYQEVNTLTGPEAEFWYAVHLLQKSWASQFSSRVELSFMPEIYPGMLLSLETFKFQAYVEQVTHSWSMTDKSGGFSTTVRVIAPSTTDRSGFYGLPLAGQAEKAPSPITLAGGRGGGVLEFL